MPTAMQDFLSILKKYDQRGPRYTSYPAAPHFSPRFSQDHWRSALAGLSGKALSLYFHIPFCKSLCWYCGCNMQVNKKPDAMQTYLAHLKKEIKQTVSWLGGCSIVKQIHFGGGSPNLLSPDQLDDLMAFVRQEFAVAQDAEISIETDPRLISESFVATLAKCGFNRVSMGIQDFNPKVQKAINRLQPYGMVAEKVALLKQAGLHAINMDVMYGLPFQNPGTFSKTLHQVLSLKPQRIALFNYAHLPQLKPHMKLIDASTIPDATTKFQLFWLAKQVFEKGGFQFIGMDHFAQKSDPLARAFANGDLHRNFQGYTTHAGLQMIGFGASAISFLNRCYVQNLSQTKAYLTSLEQGFSPIARGMHLDREDGFRASIIQRLFCQNTIDTKAIEILGGKPFDSWFPKGRDQLNDMAEDGLLDHTNSGWRATEIGQVLMRNIAMVFDEYLGKSAHGKTPTYSKTL